MFNIYNLNIFIADCSNSFEQHPLTTNGTLLSTEKTKSRSRRYQNIDKGGETMCQVIPFTLPCCRRIYVNITKLPSCPENWPKAKCPPELCIQIRYEAEDRASGVCWRCRAHMAAVTFEQKERLRPGIDSAEVVLGLEELGSTGRRKACEEEGDCWFCGAKRGCESCAKVLEVEGATGGQEKREVRNKRPPPTGCKGKPVNKRLKIDRRGRRNMAPASALASTSSKSRNDRYWKAIPPARFDHIPIDSSFVQEGSARMHLRASHSNRPPFQASRAQQASDKWKNEHNDHTNTIMASGIGPGHKNTTQATFSGLPRARQLNSQPLQPQNSQDPSPDAAFQHTNNYTGDKYTDDAMLGNMLDEYNEDPAYHGQFRGQDSQCQSGDRQPPQRFTYPSPPPR